MADAFLLSAARTPIGKYLGAFADVPAAQLCLLPNQFDPMMGCGALYPLLQMRIDGVHRARAEN